MPETLAVLLALQRHEDAEHCDCSRHLMERYGRVV
jgi:hypothetical protein